MIFEDLIRNGMQYEGSELLGYSLGAGTFLTILAVGLGCFMILGKKVYVKYKKTE